MKIFLATWLIEDEQQKALATLKHKPRLISYHHTKQARVKKTIREYFKDENIYINSSGK